MMTAIIAVLGFFRAIPAKIQLYGAVALGVAIAVGIAILKVFQAGESANAAKTAKAQAEQEANVQKRSQAGTLAGQQSESHSAAGGLRDDDGFKRDQ